MKTRLIAEIGCNHQGSFDRAIELIDYAADAGVWSVKFQKRHNLTLLTSAQYRTPHPVAENSFGSTYGEHREFLEFSISQHRELKNYCETKGLVYSSSVWDVISAEEIVDLNPEYIKVPSATNTNLDVLRILRDIYSGEVIISVGMSTHREIEVLVDYFCQENCGHRLTILACTSGYPVCDDDICFLEISRLAELYGRRVKSIGFSGHHLGCELDICAIALGASTVERHFTFDKRAKGTDHAASLDPEELKHLVKLSKRADRALNLKTEELLEVELVQRNKLKL